MKKKMYNLEDNEEDEEEFSEPGDVHNEDVRMISAQHLKSALFNHLFLYKYYLVTRATGCLTGITVCNS
jgi:hypothetical protein